MTQDPTPVQSNVYPVSVSVVTNASRALTLQFSPDPVQLSKGANALIVYNLVTPGYHFPVDGTALVINAEDASKEFPIAWVINASTLALGDYNSNSTSYKYTMRVISSSTGAAVVTDPTIDNDNTK